MGPVGCGINLTQFRNPDCAQLIWDFRFVIFHSNVTKYPR